MNQSTARVKVHRIFDRVWKDKLVKHRGAAYDWLRKALGVTRKTTISDLSEAQCGTLITKIYADFPTLRDRRYYVTSDPF